MRSLTIESPAKLNLVLRVLAKQRNGYHRLTTLFHRISLEDTLKLRKKDRGIRIFSSSPRVPKRTNLVVRAFRLLKKARPFTGGVSVHLTKRIPVGGGLGGGSSNAASFLLGMNRLYRLGLSQKELLNLGRKLGADVPFFLSGARHAVGTGVGDRIEPLPFKRRLWFLLLLDRQGLSTRAVYEARPPGRRRVSLTRVGEGVTMASKFLEKGNLTEAAPLLVNDLQESAERLRPSLRRRRTRLRELQLGTWQMSGSGPTYYALFLSRREALRLARQLGNHRFRGSTLICHTA